MHICCANCALFPLKSLRDGGHEITGLWFNPNIHPEDEYSRRLEAVRGLSAGSGTEVIYRGGYAIDEFEGALRHEGSGTGRPERCRACYRMRMRETARECERGGFDAFTTSLLVSPYQDHDLLIREAEAAAMGSGVRFYYEDFRPGWREGQALSRQSGFFRQYYCGCKYSKQERDRERAGRRRHGSPVSG